MPFQDAAGVTELTTGVPHVVRIGGRAIVLVYWDDAYFALRNVCPHQTQSFCGGKIRSTIECGERPGEIRLAADRPILACPWHQWEFGLADGRSPWDNRLRVRTYTTRVVGDRVEVDVPGS